ncbi:phosphatidylinositol N-acetylglucosaminyltransferase subunit C [Tribonema minus]|uniref:Phosphatidylinositol N-acetylglucosaminyltransferase subunit C n=1 Tax=Tribonema minus TaxID=303371 RepID=A0A835YTR5_9STRA|nr:phosphatidylinositol N-acetylglucosaminyltransferase subunit C [Tribonema minus]
MHSASVADTVKWERVLYKRQPFPDNYVPDDFLCYASRGQRRRFSWARSAVHTAALIQQLSAVATFLAIYAAIVDLRLTAQGLLLFDASAATAGAAAMSLLGGSGPPALGRAAFHLALFTALLRILAPVLRTLTACGVCHDSDVGGDSDGGSSKAGGDGSGRRSVGGGAVSLNAAVFAAVLLASRLPTNELVFGFALLAAELFALFPVVCCSVQSHTSPVGHIAMAALFAAVAASLLWLQDCRLCAAFCSIVFAVTVVCPLWLHQLSKHKCILRGPWDIADVPEIGDDD